MVHAIARRDLSNAAANLKPFIQSDNSKWSEAFQTFDPKPGVFFSALGTTRAQAGSIENQRRIDYDLNLALVKAAKESGVKTYVLISSAGVSKASIFPYGKMKAELEDAVKALGFQHTIIIKPGLLVGTRQDTRLGEGLFRGLAKILGAVSGGLLKDFWAQDVDVIGRAAVTAAMQCTNGEKEDSVWQIDQAEILRLGKSKATESR